MTSTDLKDSALSLKSAIATFREVLAIWRTSAIIRKQHVARKFICVTALLGSVKSGIRKVKCVAAVDAGF